MDSSLICVIMAAGRGTRMDSEYPKVLHEVAGEPMLRYVVETAMELGAKRIVVVVGVGKDKVISILPQDVDRVEQEPQLGTAHALMQTRDILRDFRGEVLALCGDMPLLKVETLKSLIERHRREKAHATVLTAIIHDPTGYSRIVRSNDRITRIVEEKVTTIYEKAIEEVNSEVYCFEAVEVLSCLEGMKFNGESEYSLTDVIDFMARHRKKVLAHVTEDSDEIVGVNSRRDLAMVNKILYRRIARWHMENGITIIDPETTFIGKRVIIGRDSIIYPFTVLEGTTIIGERCRVGPYTHLVSASLDNGVECKGHTFYKDGKI